MAEPVKIRVHFDYEGKEYEGDLTEIVGPGTGHMYHLHTPGQYWGVLFYHKVTRIDSSYPGDEDGWKFHSSGKNDLHCLAEPLGNIVELWYE